ncbi:MAG: hypothetical protein N2114_03155, partial [Candidatus Goldbacteria bacterium]|nr:hypothetical protein [Candidatus Goldiibacteriota bacterium]
IWMLGPVSREGQKEVYYNIIYPAKYKVIIKSNNKVQEDVKKSFEYLILYGGIGQKSRRGLGKFYSKNIKNKAKIDNLFFSKQTFDSYIEALNYLGCIYWAYRVKLKNKKEKYFLGAGKQIINNKSYDRIPSRIFFQLLKLDNNKIQPGYLLIYNNISKIELDNFKKFILNEEEIKNTLIKNMENYKTRANKIFLYRLYQKINEYLNDKFLKFEEVK